MPDNAFKFIGAFDEFPQPLNVGEVCMVGDVSYVCLGSEWSVRNAIEHSGLWGDSEKAYIQSKLYFDAKYKTAEGVDRQAFIEHTAPSNCPSCGGLINPYKPKCEFCGRFW